MMNMFRKVPNDCNRWVKRFGKFRMDEKGADKALSKKKGGETDLREQCTEASGPQTGVGGP